MSILLRQKIQQNILRDLEQKMVFLGGPRQVGKTTLAQRLIPDYRDGHPAYFNWDHAEHRKKILAREWPKLEALMVFDEVHKYKNWRNLVKGYFDTLKNSHKFLITGSARLDYYRISRRCLRWNVKRERKKYLLISNILRKERRFLVSIKFIWEPDRFKSAIKSVYCLLSIFVGRRRWSDLRFSVGAA